MRTTAMPAATTAENPNEDGDRLLMAKLDLVPLAYHAESGEAAERLPENYHTAQWDAASARFDGAKPPGRGWS